ncbi:thioredoxin [uncultured Methanomethylovorans sp.]|uniref:thioredoxin n=1 Tax=uncultured Methanomethylovorans sp. TaxID=183759 RepID=UPI002AA885E5|nr:thioredoxin [uncultured Methanomethylovorans sp.]
MDDLEAIRKKRLQELRHSLEARQYPAEPMTVTDDSFNSFISQYPLVVIDCWAQWCGPCRILSPIIDQLASELQGKIVFGKLDTDQNPKISQNMGISSIPTLLFFQKGHLVDHVSGALPKQLLLEKLRPLINGQR